MNDENNPYKPTLLGDETAESVSAEKKKHELKDKRIFISGIGLLFLHLLLSLFSSILSGTIWGNYGNWQTCGDYYECIQAEQAFLESIYFYDLRSLVFGLITFLVLYFVYRNYYEKLLKGVIISSTLGLIWFPVLWLHFGYFKPYTIDIFIVSLVSSALSYYFIWKKHITRHLN